MLRNTPQQVARLLLAVLIAATASLAQDFKKQVIYQIVTDRFFDGDKANDNPPQSAGMFDPTKNNWRLYWGGDLAGIEQKLAYLKGMGITAIWISPPVDNLNVIIPDRSGSPTAPYHGYHARDFKRIEEHFGDSGNSWTAFDSLTRAAHRNGIKIIVDFAPNHTNTRNAGEFGALYDDGKFLADYNHDPNGFFHHNPNIGDYNDRYQLQYNTLFDLADLNQENPTIDAYLKAAIKQLEAHGADGFRVDAVKHVTWGWEYSLVNAAYTYAPTFLFGEWMESLSDPLFHDSYKFANRSGMSLLDYPLYGAIREVFGGGGDFSKIDQTLSVENAGFARPNDLVTFVDNHDQPRLLSVGSDDNRLNESLAFLLTCRGIPVIYYGDEQHLHNDTRGGGDPYDRNPMTSFDTTTTAYRLIKQLAALRQSNDALAYGGFHERWMNQDVYVFERQFFNDTVLVAINKSNSSDYRIDGLLTALPAGNYPDYLNRLLGGVALTVPSGNGGGSHPVSSFTLPAHSVAVWQAAGSAPGPQVGSIGPAVGQPGLRVTLAGRGFGSGVGPGFGKVFFGPTAAAIVSWSDSSVAFAVPRVLSGAYSVELMDSRHSRSNPMPFTVLTGELVPVTFTVNNAPQTRAGDYIFLTGDTVELGNWGTTFDTAVGPMLAPHEPNWFIVASVPAGVTIRFKFLRIAADGSVTREGGSDHTYTVLASGTGSVSVDWQH